MTRAFYPAICAALALSASPASAAYIAAHVTAPAYSEAVYGTPEAPIYWEAPTPYEGIGLFTFAAQLSDPTVSFEIRNASPGATVGYGIWGDVGTVAEDGSFSMSLHTPYHTLQDNIWIFLVVGHHWSGGDLMNESFDLVEFRINGFQPPPAPEPSIWALLILGFGASGAMLRRDRRLA